MVRKLIVLILIFFLLSCFYTRTEYGNIRFKQSRFTLKPNSNNNVYKIIDTSKLYELIDVKNIKFNQQQKYYKKEFLKFYSNGRLGKFDVYYEGLVNSLDPKKATMSYYNFNGKELIMQVYFEHPQGGGLLSSRLIKIDNHFLQLTDDEYLDTYKIIDLPKEFLIYKPDW